MSGMIEHHVEIVCKLELKSNSSKQNKLWIPLKTTQRSGSTMEQLGSHLLSVSDR